MRFELTTPTWQGCALPLSYARIAEISGQSESRVMHHRCEFDKPCPAAISGVGNRV